MDGLSPETGMKPVTHFAAQARARGVARSSGAKGFGSRARDVMGTPGYKQGDRLLLAPLGQAVAFDLPGAGIRQAACDKHGFKRDKAVAVSRFKHVDGCQVCRGFFKHYDLPDGRTVHYYHRLRPRAQGAPVAGDAIGIPAPPIRLEDTGMPSDSTGTHSLRIAGATAIYNATDGNKDLAQRVGRWASDAFQAYLWESSEDA